MTHMTGFCPVEGGELYYEHSGSGSAVVLIHAGVTDHRMWDAQFEKLAGHHHVVRYDTRGYGKSRHDSRTAYSNRADLRALLDHLGIGRAALVGVSRGGQIAIDFTLESPEYVWALVPVCAGVSGYQAEMSSAEQAAEQAISDAREARDFEKLIELEIAYWLVGLRRSADQIDAAPIEKMRQMLRDHYAAHADEKHEVIGLEPPAVGRLAEINVPTLVVYGELDTHDTLATADLLLEKVRGAERSIFPNTAHLPPMEQPAAFSQTVLNFLTVIRP